MFTHAQLSYMKLYTFSYKLNKNKTQRRIRLFEENEEERDFLIVWV